MKFRRSGLKSILTILLKIAFNFIKIIFNFIEIIFSER